MYSWKKLFLVVIFTLSALALRAQYDTNVFYLRGRTALADGKYADAINNFNILASLDTGEYRTYFFRGIAKYNLGDIRGAAKDFDHSVQLNPVFTSGYHYRAVTFSRAGEYERALADHQKSIELRPGYMGLYFSRGITYFLSGRYSEALEDFDRYISREEKDPSAYLNRGACYLFLADTTKALDDYNKAIKLDRFDPEGYIRRGRLYAARNEYDDAITDMNRAIALDSTNTFAYFNRAIMLFEKAQYKESLDDLNYILKRDPGNALTLYNRSLIYAQLGEFQNALYDMDRVININKGNVLAYFNRASIFISLKRYKDAYNDYTKAIELYPDFAKAYMNRSYVANLLGRTAQSKRDYETAEKKIAEYHKNRKDDPNSFADTSKAYSKMIALDADFAKGGNFDNELLQYRDIDIRLKAPYRFVFTESGHNVNFALVKRYESPVLRSFYAAMPAEMVVSNADSAHIVSGYDKARLTKAREDFIIAMNQSANRQFNTAAAMYDAAILDAPGEGVEGIYKAFYLMNRAALKADMIEFISKFESSVHTLSMDDRNLSGARVADHLSTVYDYSEAIADLELAAAILPDFPYIYFNLANLYCLSGEHIKAISAYDKAIRSYNGFADAYFNRGLVLIYLKDKEKGCYDLSTSGEMGVKEAYSVIKKYCDDQ